jgi:hypothetical protein
VPQLARGFGVLRVRRGPDLHRSPGELTETGRAVEVGALGCRVRRSPDHAQCGGRRVLQEPEGQRFRGRSQDEPGEGVHVAAELGARVARMRGHGERAGPGEAALQLRREQQVRELRLRVGGLAAVTALELQVVETQPGAAAGDAGDRHDAGVLARQ